MCSCGDGYKLDPDGTMCTGEIQLAVLNVRINYNFLYKTSTSVPKMDSCVGLVTATMTSGPSTASALTDTCCCLVEVSGLVLLLLTKRVT